MKLNKQYYKKYFLNLVKFLKFSNFNFLYYLPSLFKKDLRNDFNLRKKNKNFFILNNVDKDIFFKREKEILESEICFISHYVGSAQKKNLDYDFHYGNLFKKLKKKNIKFTIILINHTEEKLDEIYRKFYKSKLNRVIIKNEFNLLKDIKIIFYILFKFLIFNFIKIFHINKSFRIDNYLGLTFKDFISSRHTIKLTNNIKVILDKMNNLNNLIVTYEGHAFENIIFNYCNKKNIKSFGYFFSVIREFKNSIFYNLDKSYRPNIILTSGKIITQYLKKNIQFNKNNIFTFGSSKYAKKKKLIQKIK